MLKKDLRSPRYSLGLDIGAAKTDRARQKQSLNLDVYGAIVNDDVK